MKKFCHALLLNCLCLGFAYADYPLVIIDLKARPAEEVTPMLKPFLGKNGTLVGRGNKLIIRAAPQDVQNIRDILHQIDTRQKRLIIHVRQGRTGAIKQSLVGYGADIELGDDTHAAVGKQKPQQGVSLHARSLHTQNKGDSLQHIQTLEGQPAFIATGRSVPIRNYRRNPFEYESMTYYKRAITGFFVIAHVRGDRVTLKIGHQQERPTYRYPQTGMQFDLRQTATTVAGALGEWINLSGSNRDIHGDRSSLNVIATTSDNRDWSVQLRVELAP